jgi:hypothetical protein
MSYCLSVFRMLDEKKNRTASYITLSLMIVQYIQKWPPSFSMHNLARLRERISTVYCFLDVKAMAGYNSVHLWSLISLHYYLQRHAHCKCGVYFAVVCTKSNEKFRTLAPRNKFRLFSERKVLLSLSTTRHHWRYGSFNSKHRYEKQWETSFTSVPI